MSVEIRQYQPRDYPEVAALYQKSELYGGQYDDNRDAKERLHRRIEADPDAIVVAVAEEHVVGTVSRKVMITPVFGRIYS